MCFSIVFVSKRLYLHSMWKVNIFLEGDGSPVGTIYKALKSHKADDPVTFTLTPFTEGRDSDSVTEGLINLIYEKHQVSCRYAGISSLVLGQ